MNRRSHDVVCAVGLELDSLHRRRACVHLDGRIQRREELDNDYLWWAFYFWLVAFC